MFTCRKNAPILYRLVLSSLCLCVVFFFNFGLLDQCLAQVVLDGTMGGTTGHVGPGMLPDGKTLSNGLNTTDHLITDDLGQHIGNNLFHSFSEFSIPAGQSATFTGPGTITSILSRVTGNNVSNINGTLASTIEGADLYFMNPNGIIFGEKATLDIKGSFYATTANNIELADGELFNATPGKGDALLTSAPPEAFGFINESPSNSHGNILIEGALGVLPEQTISIVGRGSIENGPDNVGVKIAKGSLLAQSGNIRLISVATKGKVGINNDYNEQTASQHGSIEFSDGANITTSGNRGGSVVIRGGMVQLEDGTAIKSEKTGNGNSNPIAIDIIADTLTAKGRTTEISALSTFADKNTGDIILRVGHLHLEDGAKITSSTLFGPGNAGNIDIVATDSLSVVNGQILSQTNFSTGNAGHIKIKAVKMTLETDNTANTNATISTQSAGEPVEGQSGNAGNITLDSDQLTIKQNAVIRSDTQGSGRAGDISIKANNKIVISGKESTSFGAGITSSTSGEGNAGNILIETRQLEIINSGYIASETSNSGSGGLITIHGFRGGNSPVDNITIAGRGLSNNPSGISTTSSGQGPAGNIKLNVKTLVTGSGAEIVSKSLRQEPDAGAGGSIDISATDSIILSATTLTTSVEGGTKPGGDIKLTAGQNVLISEGTKISTESASTNADAGNAGKIALRAQDIIRIDNSTVTTRAQRAVAGDITLKAENLIQLLNSDIISKVPKGVGSAGQITLDPLFIVTQNSVIDSSADRGDGGDVTFIADAAILIDPFSTIDTSSRFPGRSGSVNIRAPIQNLGGTIAPLPEEILKISGLFADRCAAQKDGKFSSFVREAGGIFGPPGQFLTSPLPDMRATSVVTPQEERFAFLNSIRVQGMISSNFNQTNKSVLLNFANLNGRSDCPSSWREDSTVSYESSAAARSVMRTNMGSL